MYSLEYASTLISETDLASRIRPCLLILPAMSDRPGEEDVPSQVVLLNRPLMLVGRDPTCGIRIQDRFVSRVHASITRLTRHHQESYWLRDGDGRDKPSANGVMLNGKRLREAHQLRDGDLIRFGTRALASFHEIRVPTAADHTRHTLLADLLPEAGLITSSQLESAQAEQVHCQMLLGEILVMRGWIAPETVEFLLRDQAHVLPQGAGKHPIGEYFKAAGLVTEGQIVEALRLQKRKKIYFGMALVERGYLKEATLDFFLHRYGEVQEGATAATQDPELDLPEEREPMEQHEPDLDPEGEDFVASLEAN